MIADFLFALTFAAALGAGLMAGLFFAFSAFIMAALGRLPPAGGIAAMQSINVGVLNPWFFAVFFGTGAAGLILAVAAVLQWDGPRAGYRLAGAALYLAGAILVTMRFNVPLNRVLAAADPASAEGAGLWARYRSRWTGWNHLRTAGSLAATAAFVLALR